MNKKTKRQCEVLNIIKSQGMVPVKNIAAILQVSEMTIRRDLEELKYQLSENRPGGGDTPPADEEEGYNLFQAIQKSNEQKERIGKLASSLLNNGDVIILDTGSTTDRMLPYIPSDKNLTVVCFNANVLFALRHKPGIRIYFAGGTYHQNTEMFESPEGIQFIRRLRANKVFLSAAGIHETLGITCANEYEIVTKNAIIESSSERILLADSSKFNQVCSFYFCDLDVITSVVTDSDIPGPWKKRINDRDIPLYLA